MEEKKQMAAFMIIGLLVLGVAAGYFSGLVGIGGGVIIVPALVLLFGFSQHMAQGTTLAMMVPPIGILAVLNYHQKGQVDLKTAAILCLGFVVGGYLGSNMSLSLSQDTLKKIFAGLLVVLGIRMFLS
jgi:hypothetical protein